MLRGTMLRLEISKIANPVIWIVSFILSILIAGIGGLLKIDVSKLNLNPWKDLISFIQANAWWHLPLLMTITVVIQFFNGIIGSPKAWSSIQHLLDEFRNVLYPTTATNAKEPWFHHKVTLFKLSHNINIFSPFQGRGWLNPVARCGDVMRGGIPRFHTPLNQPDKAEGVCGRAWTNQNPLLVINLPDLNIPTPSDDDFKKYSKEGFVSEKWLRKRQKQGKIFPRSVLACPILKSGSIWGILVFDSIHPAETTEDTYYSPNFRSLIAILSKNIEMV
jgi:hypothetical protein